MDSIVNDLKFALHSKALVNVYQVAQDVVYTGYVHAVDQSGIILKTFDDSGSDDGAVYLTYGVIDFVEFESDDLDSMQFRINYAVQEKFVTFGEMDSEFDAKRPLIRQVLESAMVMENVVMVLDNQHQEFIEGEVTRTSQTDFDYQVFDKFDLSRHPKRTISYQDVALVEFEGKELSLQTASIGFLQTSPHIETKAATSLTDIAKALEEAMENESLIALSPTAEEGMFFVGRVNTISADSVIINLVDMTGQFGGYWLVKLPAIASVTIAADYLEVMKTYMTLDLQLGAATQPILNDERLFDATTDLFKTVLNQAKAFKQVIRLEMVDDQSLTGYVSKVGEHDIIFHQIEQGTIIDVMGTMYQLSDIEEVAFDYLDAILTEKQLRSQGDL